MLKKEWQNFFKNRFLVIVMIGIITIPTIYTTIFLGSMWDPYGSLDKLPVAVVNKDKAVTYQNQTMDLGKEMSDSLMKDKSLDFHFVDATKASEGLTDGTYYMVITIPENFSYNATTLLNSNPQKMELDYQTNPGTNYIASKMDETAINKIKESISIKVTQTYANTLFNQISTMGNGLQTASDGASQIDNGLQQLTTGNLTLSDSLNTLSTSTLTFKNGAETLVYGLQDYTNGVSQIKDGADQLQAGINQLNNYSSDLNNGVTALDSGLTQLQQGSQTLLDGLNQMSNSLGNSLTAQQMNNIDLLKTNLPKLNDGIQTLNKSLQESDNATLTSITSSLQAIASNTQAASTNIEGMINDLKNSSAFTGLDTQTQNALLQSLTSSTHLSDLKQNLNTIGTNLSTTNQSLNEMITTLTTNVNTIATSANQLLPGSIQAIDTLSNGLMTIKDNLDKPQGLIDGTNQLYQGITLIKTSIDGNHGLKKGLSNYTNGVANLNSGSQALSTGLNTLNDNSKTLLSGGNELNLGAGLIYNGSTQLADGSTTIGNNLNLLANGSQTLSSSLKDGASQINGVSTNDQTIEMFANPVHTSGTTLSEVANNGHAMAPYMMSVGLYVGCIAFCLMYPLLKHSTNKIESSFKWWFSKATIMGVIACLQALLMIGMLMWINHLNPLETLQTFLVACLISLTFMSIIVFFNLLLDKVGSFVVLVFMVLQLGGAAGTYPIELSGSFFQALHPYMPFTYSVHAFRNTLSIGGNITQDIIIFSIILLVFTLLTLALYQYKTKKMTTQLA